MMQHWLAALRLVEQSEERRQEGTWMAWEDCTLSEYWRSGLAKGCVDWSNLAWLNNYRGGLISDISKAMGQN